VVMHRNRMLATTGRTVARSGLAGQWLRGGHVRTATFLSSSIKLSSVPAPHAGSIAVLSLNRPRARNAARQPLSEYKCRGRDPGKDALSCQCLAPCRVSLPVSERRSSQLSCSCLLVGVCSAQASYRYHPAPLVILSLVMLWIFRKSMTGWCTVNGRRHTAI